VRVFGFRDAQVKGTTTVAKALANILADLGITEKLCVFVNTPNNMWAGATLANILASPGITETLYVLFNTPDDV